MRVFCIKHFEMPMKCHDNAVLWRVEGDCDNFLVLQGHKNVVLELHWTPDGRNIVSASPDHTVRAFDAETGKQVREIMVRGKVTGCSSRVG